MAARRLGTARRIIRFLDAQNKEVKFGLVPDSLDPQMEDFSSRLAGQTVSLVEMVKERQTRLYDYQQQQGENIVGLQSTNHVTDCRAVDFCPTDQQAEVGLLLAPLPLDPAPAVWCVGLNYRKHWEEGAKKRGEPLPDVPSTFMKPASSLCGPGHPVWVPTPGSQGDRFALSAGSDLHTKVDYEGELAIVVGRAARNIKEEEVMSGGYVLGFTAANDVSQRHWQRNSGGGQWGRGKSLDTYCPLGPCLLLAKDTPTTKEEVNVDLAISTKVNGEVRQESRTGDLIFGVAAVVSWLSRSTTLVPGTVILTGTPSGVGYAREGGPYWLAKGDKVTVSIEGVGSLVNPVAEEPI